MSEEDQPDNSVNTDFQISPMQSIAIHANELFNHLTKAGFSEQHAIFVISQVVITAMGDSIYPSYLYDSLENNEDDNDINDEDDDSFGDEEELF